MKDVLEEIYHTLACSPCSDGTLHLIIQRLAMDSSIQQIVTIYYLAD